MVGCGGEGWKRPAIRHLLLKCRLLLSLVVRSGRCVCNQPCWHPGPHICVRPKIDRTSRACPTAPEERAASISCCCCCCCCFSHINSHNKVRGHRAGSSRTGVEDYPRGGKKNSMLPACHTAPCVVVLTYLSRPPHVPS